MPSNEERPVETSLYYITSRYYDPEIGRFISPDSIDYLDPTTINGLNLYAYCNNDPVNNALNSIAQHCSYRFSKNEFIISKENNVLFKAINNDSNTNRASYLTFSVGVVTPKMRDLPSWMNVYAFYVRGSIGWGYTFGYGYSLASLSLGVLDSTFHTPKWFSLLPEDNIANPNLFFGVSTWNVHGSLGFGIKGTAEIISGTIGVRFGDSISISTKAYVGIGISLDFTKGIKFGAGWGLGYEISLEVDWYELFH